MERLKPESENVGGKKKETVWGQKNAVEVRVKKKQVDWEIQGMSLQHLFPCGLLNSGFFRNAVSNPGRAIFRSKPCFAHFLSHSSSLKRHSLSPNSFCPEGVWVACTDLLCRFQLSQPEPQTSLPFSNDFLYLILSALSVDHMFSFSVQGQQIYVCVRFVHVCA